VKWHLISRANVKAARKASGASRTGVPVKLTFVRTYLSLLFPSCSLRYHPHLLPVHCAPKASFSSIHLQHPRNNHASISLSQSHPHPNTRASIRKPIPSNPFQQSAHTTSPFPSPNNGALSPPTSHPSTPSPPFLQYTHANQSGA
jgi:hypothetical protein